MSQSTGKREVCFILAKDGTILYADVSNSPTLIPDSRRRWDVIWNNRDRIMEIAHSHPISSAHFSQEDETTMQALRQALGFELRFSVISADAMLLRVNGKDQIVEDEPWWVELMRVASGMDMGNADNIKAKDNPENMKE